MKAATVSELKHELINRSPKELVEICLTLSKFKKEQGKEELLEQTYYKCKEQLEQGGDILTNPVIELYEQFDYKEISKRIAE